MLTLISNSPLLIRFLQVQTDFQQISEAQFAITIPDADNINHLVVFLTGTVPFPDGFGGSGMMGKASYFFLIKVVWDPTNNIILQFFF